MKKAIFLLVICQAVWAQDAPKKAETGEHHEFVISNFRTEGGVTLPVARIEYGTYGHLNAARDNVVLLPSHYMADSHGYEWLIGPGHALDTSQLFLVATELFGNGHSSSPSNTPEPFHGPRFPLMTIHDNVEAVHRLLTEELKITHVRAIIGFSMGAQQAFCTAPVGRKKEYLLPNPQFGLKGSITTQEACDAAGGTFHPVIFNWMVHVYPFEKDQASIWSVERQHGDAD
jgi:hypothetical protein